MTKGTGKKTAAKAEEKETVMNMQEVVTEKAEEPAAAKKEPAKKAPVKKATKAVAAEEAPAKKAPAKKATKAAAAKEAPAAEAAPAVQAAVSVQFAGKEYTTEQLVEIAKAVWQYDLGRDVAEIATVELYVKPEESAVYYVINGDTTGSFGI